MSLASTVKRLEAENKELQEHCDTLERKIEHYVEQQSLFKLMRDDLENYKKIAQMSKELAIGANTDKCLTAGTALP